MSQFGFGRPKNGLIQTAFLVPDLRVAVRHWTDTMKGGPWFVTENFAGDDSWYRGSKALSRSDVALGFVGNMQIELIQPLDEGPGIHQEYLAEHGYGFYHFGISCYDPASTLKQFEDRGFELVYKTRVPTGDVVYYLKSLHGGAAGLIELITPNDNLDTQFSRMWKHHTGWDGSRPWRAFSELADED